MKLTIDTKIYNTPESWEELSLEQKYQAHHILFLEDYKQLDSIEKLTYVKIELFKILTGLDNELINSIQEESTDEDDFYQKINHLLQVCDPFFEETEVGTIPILGLYEAPFDMLTPHEKMKLKPPKPELENITIYEMGYLFNTYELYLQEKKEEYIDKIISILYRPHKPKTKENIQSRYEGDIRLPLIKHESTIERRQKYIAKMPLRSKLLILFYFQSCRDKIMKSYPFVFSGKERTDDMTDYSWAGTMFDLAGSLDKLEQIQNMNHATVLLFKNKENEEITYQNLKNAANGH